MNEASKIQESILDWLSQDETNSISKLSKLSGLTNTTVFNVLSGLRTPQIRTLLKILSVTMGQNEARRLLLNQSSLETSL